MHLADHKAIALHHRAFKHVGQRQIREHAVFLPRRHDASHVLRYRQLGGGDDALKAVHHALGLAGGARGVNQHGQIGARALRKTGHGRGACGDGVPSVIRCGGGQREGDARHVRRNAGLLLRPGIELADKQQAGFAVLQHKADGGRRLGGEDGHRGVAGHPNSQLGHKEVGAVFGQDANARARRKAQAVQVGGHAPRLVHGLAPGVVHHLALAHRLGEVDVIGQVFFVLVDVVQQPLGVCHESLSLGFIGG